MDKVRYGFIGAGMMACGHYRCIDAIPDVELVAVADPSEQSMNVFKHCMKDPGILSAPGTNLMEKYRELESVPAPAVEGSVRFFSDYRELLALDGVDAVVISTPDHTHVDIVADSLAAHKHVLSEKPAATSHEQLRKLEDAVRRTNRVYQVGLECRYLPVFKKMRSMVEENAVGNPRMVWCLEFRGPFLEKRGNWIMFQDKTGGVFVEKTCHYFDLMTWLSDSTPKKVVALAGQDAIKDIYGIKPDVFDNGWVIIEYENGVKGMLGLCMFSHHPLSVGVVGDAGKMEGLFGAQKINYSKRGGNVTEIDAKEGNEYSHLSHGGGVYFEHMAFVDNIRNNRTPLTDINVAKWSTLVGLAAEESARNGSTPVTF